MGDRSVRPELEDVWHAYVDGARSGQRHPRVGVDMLNRCADAYVKSRWILDRATGHMLDTAKRDIIAEAIRQTMLEVDAQHRAGVAVNLMTIDYPSIIAKVRQHEDSTR